MGTKNTRAIGSIKLNSDRVPKVLSTLLRSGHELEKEDAFNILYNPRRRQTLQLLAQHGRSYSMDELVERIAAKENDVPVGDLKRQQRRRVHVSLYQTHLPLLDETDAIKYDQQSDRIEPGPALRELVPYLDIAATTVPWRTYYQWLFVGSLVLGMVALSGLLVTPSPVVLGVSVSTLFVLLALVHGAWDVDRPTSGGLTTK